MAAPVALLRGYARLGLSDGELAVVLQLWSYWWEERLPCPAVSTLATQLGKTERQVQQILASLRRRGLVAVHPRYDRERGQLSNAYDLGPLLRALETLPPVVERPAQGMLPVAGEGVRKAAGEGVRKVAPNEDPKVRSLVLVSDPPTPPARMDLSEELSAWLDQLGQQLGDAAPTSSRTRAARLLVGCGLDDNDFRARFGQAARIALEALPMVRRRGSDGTANGMPYCFAVLEALLENRPEPPEEARPRVRRAVLVSGSATSPEPACPLSEATAELEEHPLWPAVMTALAGMLAPAVFVGRVKPLRSRIGSDGALEIVARESATARWVKARLGHRIQEAMDLAAPEPPIWRVIT